MKEEAILTDRFGRFHDYLRISLTDRCNFRCFYCMPEEGAEFVPHEQLMTKDEIVQIARTFIDLGVRKIRLTGGEPLVRKDAADIIRELGKLPVELAITTNGALLDRYLPVFKEAGLRNVNVSLDTLHPEKFSVITRRQDYHKVLSNIHLLMHEDFHVKVNVVVTKGMNANELMDFIDWTREYPVHVRFIEFMPFGGNKWEREKMMPYDTMLDLIQSRYPVQRLHDKQNDTAKNYRITGHKGTFAVISSVTAPFCDTCNRLRITAEGKIRNCLFADQEIDLLTALRNGEAIEPLIRESVMTKEKQWAGKDGFEQVTERSMTTIGG